MTTTAVQDIPTLVVGSGSIGTRHLRNLKELGVSNVAVCDTRDEALDRALPFASDSYVDFENALMCFQPQAVFICTTPDCHVPQALLAAECGADLFIEKPLSHSSDGVDRLKAIVREKDLITMVGCNMRFHGGPSRVRELLLEGRIGRPLAARLYMGSYLPHWRPGTDYRSSYSASHEQGGGVVLDAIHEIDLALWLFGEASEVTAMTRPAESIGLDVEGLAEILMSHTNGTLSSVHLNFVQVNARRFCDVVGETGTLSWDISRPHVRAHRLDDPSGETVEVDGDWDSIYVREISHFLGCVCSRTQPQSSLEEGARALRVALAAKESAAKGRAVRIPEAA